MDLGLSRLVCMRSFFQYPRFVTPIRLRDQPSPERTPDPDEEMPSRPTKGRSASTKELTRIQFNDQRFVDFSAEFIAVRGLLEDAFHLGGIDLDPSGQTDRLGQLQAVLDAELLLGLLANGHHATG